MTPSALRAFRLTQPPPPPPTLLLPLACSRHTARNKGFLVALAQTTNSRYINNVDVGADGELGEGVGGVGEGGRAGDVLQARALQGSVLIRCRARRHAALFFPGAFFRDREEKPLYRGVSIHGLTFRDTTACTVVKDTRAPTSIFRGKKHFTVINPSWDASYVCSLFD